MSPLLAAHIAAGGVAILTGYFALFAGKGSTAHRSGIPAGARKIARHLWRMCFALFVAAGSFFLGQADEIPAPLRIWPILFVLALTPLVLLLYWMWRVRFRRSLRGMQLLNRNDPVVAAAIR
jgi:hypothetical protein